MPNQICIPTRSARNSFARTAQLLQRIRVSIPLTSCGAAVLALQDAPVACAPSCCSSLLRQRHAHNTEQGHEQQQRAAFGHLMEAPTGCSQPFPVPPIPVQLHQPQQHQHQHFFPHVSPFGPRSSLASLLLDFRSSLGRALGEVPGSADVPRDSERLAGNDTSLQDLEQLLQAVNSDDVRTLERWVLDPSTAEHSGCTGSAMQHVKAPLQAGTSALCMPPACSAH